MSTKPNNPDHAREHDTLVAPLRIDPDAIYGMDDIVVLFKRTPRCIQKRVRKGVFPKPFRQGRDPYWRGTTILRHFTRLQGEAR